MSEQRICPHCDIELESWIGPPETMWGEIFVCNNDECVYYLSSNDCLSEQGAKESLAFRYAVDPMNNDKSFNLLSWMPPAIREKARQYMESHGCKP